MEQTLIELGVAEHFKVTYTSAKLDDSTVALCMNANAVVLFADDSVHDRRVLRKLRDNGVSLIVLRYTGRESVNEKIAMRFGLIVKQVSPNCVVNTVAEHVVSMIYWLHYKMSKTSTDSTAGFFQPSNFSVRPPLSNRTLGVIGTDKVSCQVVRIMTKLGCKVLAYDVVENEQVIADGGKYVTLSRLLERSDIISLHVPQVRNMKNLISTDELARCKYGVDIVNVSNFTVIDINALYNALISGRVSGFAADILDDITAPYFRLDQKQSATTPDIRLDQLKNLHNVSITAHQSTATLRAQKEIAAAVVDALNQFLDMEPPRPNGSISTSN